MIDLSNQRVRDSFDAMLEAACEVLSPKAALAPDRL